MEHIYPRHTQTEMENIGNFSCMKVVSGNDFSWIAKCDIHEVRKINVTVKDLCASAVPSDVESKSDSVVKVDSERAKKPSASRRMAF